MDQEQISRDLLKIALLMFDDSFRSDEVKGKLSGWVESATQALMEDAPIPESLFGVSREIFNDDPNEYDGAVLVLAHNTDGLDSGDTDAATLAVCVRVEDRYYVLDAYLPDYGDNDCDGQVQDISGPLSHDRALREFNSRINAGVRHALENIRRYQETARTQMRRFLALGEHPEVLCGELEAMIAADEVADSVCAAVRE